MPQKYENESERLISVCHNNRLEEERARKMRAETLIKSLEPAVREFKEKPHTPENITSYWQTVWSVLRGEKAGLIPPCDRDAEEIKQLEAEGRKMIYVPNDLASKENRHRLADILGMERPDSDITNESSQGGWFDIEASLSPKLDALDAKEKGLKNQSKQQGKVGQTLNVWMVGSFDAKLQTGHYFDEKTSSRIPWSHYNYRSQDYVVAVSFGIDHGHVFFQWETNPEASVSDSDGRFQGSKKV